MSSLNGLLVTLQNCQPDDVQYQSISVLKIKETFEKINGVSVPTEFVERRAGDLAGFYADASRAKQELSWTPQYSLEDMLADSWNWQKQNPNGYN